MYNKIIIAVSAVCILTIIIYNPKNSEKNTSFRDLPSYESTFFDSFFSYLPLPSDTDSPEELKEIHLTSIAKDILPDSFTKETPYTSEKSETGNYSLSSFENEIHHTDLNKDTFMNDELSTDSSYNDSSDPIQESSHTPLPQIQPHKKIFFLDKYLNNLKYQKHKIITGDTLTKIASNYEKTCNLNTSIKYICLINHITKSDDLSPGSILLIPDETLKKGKLYKVTLNDTWYSIITDNYPDYAESSINSFLITINDLPNNDLPLNEYIFLPELK